MKIDPKQSNKLGFFKRLFGKCLTKPPADPDCWTFQDGKIIVVIEKAPELTQQSGAVKLEGKSLPVKVLIICGDDGQYYAFHNKCAHGGRELDPVPEAGTVQCCSVGKSIFDYEGKVLAGSAKEGIETYMPRSKRES